MQNNPEHIDPLAPEPAEDENVIAAENAAEAAPHDEQDQVAALETALADAKDRLLRAVADAENTRKRAAREKEDAAKYAVSGFARDLLDFADNFRRALDAVPEDLKTDARIASVLDGITAMEKAFLGTFEKHGITKLEPLDQPFDPHVHEVMFESPVPDKSPGTIIQVMEPGYLLHDRLLRPARVGIVQRNTAPPAGKTGDTIDTEA